MASGGNVDVARALFQALDEDGPEGIIRFLHPDFEATTPPALAAEPDTYRGDEGIRRYFDSFYEAMDQIRFEPTGFHEVGKRVVIEITLQARGRTTGIETEQRIVAVWSFSDGQVIRMDVYGELDEAIEAAAN